MTEQQATWIESTAAYVQHTLSSAEAGHDWQHVYRVWRNAVAIAKTEPGADRLVVELSALLHDIADSKFHGGDEEIGPRTAAAWLHSLGVDTPTIEQVQQIVRHVSFKGGHRDAGYLEGSIELSIVQDADRLDALGAIGIARTFHYGGYKNRAIYDPAIPPAPNQSKEAYKNSQSPSINHFYEKILLLKDRMNTATGKRMAEQRHTFIEEYLRQFYAEWEGER